MAITEQDRTNRTNVARPNQQPKIMSSTEARRGFMTTEFWLSLVIAAALVVIGHVDDNGLAVDQAWALAAGVIAAYSLSRGFAKAGSSEPVDRDFDVDAR